MGARLLAIAAIMPLSGCMTTAISNDVPHCEKLIPQSLLDPVKGASLPDARQLPDGHDDAQPWQEGFIEQTGQLEKANQNSPAVDHIYRECLELHREALKRSSRGFFARLFQ